MNLPVLLHFRDVLFGIFFWNFFVGRTIESLPGYEIKKRTHPHRPRYTNSMGHLVNISVRHFPYKLYCSFWPFNFLKLYFLLLDF